MYHPPNMFQGSLVWLIDDDIKLAKVLPGLRPLIKSNLASLAHHKALSWSVPAANNRRQPALLLQPACHFCI